MASARPGQRSPVADVPSPAPTTAPRATVDRAFWSAFTRADDGWTGGDGTNSVLLPDGRTVWLFADTFLGAVNPDLTRPTTAPLIHNSLVVQDGATLTTLHGGSRKAPRALFPLADGAAWYWPADATVEGQSLRLVLLRFLRHGPEGWAWRWVGTDLASLRLPDLALQSVVPLPVDNGVRYGSAILEAPDHTYVYGVEDLGAAKFCHLARAQPDRLLGPWEFFDGRGWSPSPAATTRLLADSIGPEFSVLAVAGGYALITIDTSPPLSQWREIVAYVASHPAGPWTVRTLLYVAPEADHEHRFVYNAHAHPQFGGDPSLLVSYNVNSFRLEDIYADANLFRARFVRVALPHLPP